MDAGDRGRGGGDVAVDSWSKARDGINYSSCGTKGLKDCSANQHLLFLVYFY